MSGDQLMNLSNLNIELQAVLTAWPGRNIMQQHFAALIQ